MVNQPVKFLLCRRLSQLLRTSRWLILRTETLNMLCKLKKKFFQTFSIYFEFILGVKHLNFNTPDIKHKGRSSECKHVSACLNRVCVRVCVCFTGKSSVEVQTDVHSGKPVIHGGRGGEWFPDCWHFGSSTAQLHFWTIPTVLKLVLKEVEGWNLILMNTWNCTTEQKPQICSLRILLLCSLFLFYALIYWCEYVLTYFG